MEGMSRGYVKTNIVDIYGLASNKGMSDQCFDNDSVILSKPK